MKNIFAIIGFCAVFLGAGFIIIAQFSNLPPQPDLAPQNPGDSPHASGITPPPIPEILPILQDMPRNHKMLHVPRGKDAEAFHLSKMTLEELIDRFKTNRMNLVLVVFSDKPPVPLRHEQVTPAEAEVLRTYREGQPRHP